MERIGIYGGTFNPPHVGHIRAAQYALTALQLDKLLLVPSCKAPHKTHLEDTPTPRQRFEMLLLAAGENLEVCDLELHRGGISYTYETVEEIAALYTDAERILLMGTDMFLSFLSWREPERILQKASIGVFCRGEKDEEERIAAQKAELEARGHKVYLLDNPVTAISSTQLRRLLAFRCADSFLPEGVADYIRAEALYGTDTNYRNLPMDALEQVVVSLLKPDRVEHVLGCRDTAAKLAKHWHANETDAARAGLLHDITKALDGSLQLTLCREYGIVLGDFSRKYPKTLHALTGSLVAERIFGENREVVSAICSHTTGKADMTVLEKIVYIADYIEPKRSFPGVEELRRLAYEDLDKALKMGLEMTISLLQKNKQEISPESAEALAFLQQAGV